MNAFAACRSYLDKLPPAVSGSGGHPATFRAACECVRFALGDADALALLREYNRRCSPPWTEKELAHKLADARGRAGGQVRTFRQTAPAVRVAWKITRKPSQQAEQAEPVKVKPPPAPAAPSSFDVPQPHPAGEIPKQFVDTLRTWPGLLADPFWHGHPQLTSP